MFGRIRPAIGQFYQVAVRIPAIERADRARGAAAIHRACDDLYTTGLKVVRHVWQRCCGEEAEVGGPRRRAPRHQVVGRGIRVQVDLLAAEMECDPARAEALAAQAQRPRVEIAGPVDIAHRQD